MSISSEVSVTPKDNEFINVSSTPSMDEASATDTSDSENI